MQSATIKELTEVIRNWVKLLSEDKFDQACELLISSSNSNQQWNENALRKLIMDYSIGEQNPVITNPNQMDLARERIEFYGLEDNSGWTVEYDIPINGDWSDLTAQFRFDRNKSGYDFILEDIHVL